MQQQTVYPPKEPAPCEQFLEFLRRTPELYEEFSLLTPKLQEEFLNFCTGASGLMMCYDPFFKYIFDADIHPERLSDLLSAILKRKVTVKKVLPQESRRIMAKGSLLIMDIVVELEDGALANVEIQRIPYAFPGPRSACYSSDLVLRQYSSVKKQNRKKFSYKKLKTVYTIVILENSTSAFHQMPDEYLHHSRQTFDTGLPLDLIQEYIFIPLDVFRTIVHNEGIRNELEAWLAFLAFDDPRMIWKIRSAFPKFDSLYQDMADFRKNPEEVLHMFSKELEIMDENTVQYMIDELQAQVERERRKSAKMAAKAEAAERAAALKAEKAERAAALKAEKAEQETAELKAEIQKLKEELNAVKGPEAG